MRDNYVRSCNVAAVTGSGCAAYAPHSKNYQHLHQALLSGIKTDGLLTLSTPDFGVTPWRYFGSQLSCND
jgi:hypothetical protein